MKNKRILSILSVLVIAGTLMVGCGNSNKTDNPTTKSKQEKTKQESYNIGDTITISDPYKGKYELTITNLEESSERDKFNETKVEQVVKITYKYKLLETGETTNGLFVNDDDMQVVDADGQTCQPYNLMSSEFPQELKAPETSCIAEACFGIKNKTDEVSIIIPTSGQDSNDYGKITVNLNKS